MNKLIQFAILTIVTLHGKGKLVAFRAKRCVRMSLIQYLICSIHQSIKIDDWKFDLIHQFDDGVSVYFRSPVTARRIGEFTVSEFNHMHAFTQLS